MAGALDHRARRLAVVVVRAATEGPQIYPHRRISDSDRAGHAHSTVRRLDRQREVKGAPLPFGALHPDAATMRVDDELAEGKAKTGAARPWNALRLDAFELAKDHLVVLR